MSYWYEKLNEKGAKTNAEIVAFFELNEEEKSYLTVMDKHDELSRKVADYYGYPVIQAQIIVDSREENTGYEATREYDNVVGMGLTRSEMGVKAVSGAEIRVA